MPLKDFTHEPVGTEMGLHIEDGLELKTMEVGLAAQSVD